MEVFLKPFAYGKYWIDMFFFAHDFAFPGNWELLVQLMTNKIEDEFGGLLPLAHTIDYKTMAAHLCGSLLFLVQQLCNLQPVTALVFIMRAVCGGIWGHNPVFGLVVCLVILFFYRRFPEKKMGHLLLRGMVTVAALVWCSTLSIQYGSSLVVIFVVLWAFRTKPMLRSMAGAAASILCFLFSMFFLAAPMGFLAVHFYNGEKGADNRWVNYLTYPVLLLMIGMAGAILA